jgi:hypothetical protein
VLVVGVYDFAVGARALKGKGESKRREIRVQVREDLARLARVAKQQRWRLVVLGDYNATETKLERDNLGLTASSPDENSLLRWVLGEGLTSAVRRHLPTAKLMSHRAGRLLDHIYVDAKTAETVTCAGVDTLVAEAILPSDHSPVWCDVSIGVRPASVGPNPVEQTVERFLYKEVADIPMCRRLQDGKLLPRTHLMAEAQKERIQALTAHANGAEAVAALTRVTAAVETLEFATAVLGGEVL